MRITNMFQAQNNISRIQKSVEDVYKSDMQVATGLKAEKYSEVAADLSQILKTKESMTQLESYEKNLTTTESYLSSVESALQSMQSILTEATSLATLALNENTPEDRAALAATAEGLAANFDSLLNQKFQGKYMFAGQATDVAVTSGTSANAFVTVPADTTYYSGATEKLTTVVSQGSTMEYGITGDNQGFADLKAGLEALWYGLENNDETSLSGALDLISSAQDGFGNMLGIVGGEMTQVDILQQQHQNTNDFLTEQLQQLQGVDSAEAISNLSTNEAVLEANLSLMSRVNQISLLDYL